MTLEVVNYSETLLSHSVPLLFVPYVLLIGINISPTFCSHDAVHVVYAQMDRVRVLF